LIEFDLGLLTCGNQNKITQAWSDDEKRRHSKYSVRLGTVYFWLKALLAAAYNVGEYRQERSIPMNPKKEKKKKKKENNTKKMFK